MMWFGIMCSLGLVWCWSPQVPLAWGPQSQGYSTNDKSDLLPFSPSQTGISQLVKIDIDLRLDDFMLSTEEDRRAALGRW